MVVEPVNSKAPTAAELLDGEQPMWEQIPFDVLCSRCDYNLRMLARPRCPECGLEFEWLDVLDRNRRRVEFLFEHRWRDQPIRSFARTLWASLRPRHFWSQVSIHDLIRPGPLIVLILVAPVLFLLALHSVASAFGTIIQAILPRPISSASAEVAARIGQQLTYIQTHTGQTIRVATFLWLCVLAAAALLCVLRQTLARCRVRTIHVMRITAYAAPPMFIAMALGVLVSITFLSVVEQWLPATAGAKVIAAIISLACAPLALCYFWFFSPGVRLYLRLPQPRFVTVVCGIVGVLTAATIFAVIAAGW